MSITPTHKGIYIGEHIDLTGVTFLMMATFKDCTVERREGPEAKYPACIFDGCEFTGDGWPEGWGSQHACPNGMPEYRHDA